MRWSPIVFPAAFLVAVVAFAQPQPGGLPASRVTVQGVAGADDLQEALDEGAISGGEDVRLVSSACTAQTGVLGDVCLQVPAFTSNLWFRWICTAATCDGVTLFQWRRAEGNLWSVAADPNTVDPVTASACPAGSGGVRCDCNAIARDFAWWSAQSRMFQCVNAATDTWLEITGGSLAVSTPTSSPAALTACNGLIVSNAAIADTLRIDLCAATPGMEVWIVWDDATRQVDVEPTANDRILSPDTDQPGDGLRWTAGGMAGSVLHLVSTSSTTWRVVSLRGTAPTDNNSGGS